MMSLTATARPHLVIAGTAFSLELPPGMTLAEDDRCYRPFLTGGKPAPGQLVVPTAITVGKVDRPAGTPAFDSGSAWTAFRHGDSTEFHLDLGTRGGGPLWSARLDENPFSVRVVGDRRLVNHAGGRVLLTNPVRYPLDQILVTHILSHGLGLVLHAAGMISGGSAFVFVGVSGAGKTTFMRAVAGAQGITRLSDDRIVVRRTGGHYVAHGTPWAGEGQVASAAHAEMGGLVFLRQAAHNRLEPVEPSRALRSLLPAASLLWYDAARVERMLDWCDGFLAEVPCFELYFRPDESVLEALVPLGVG